MPYLMRPLNLELRKKASLADEGKVELPIRGLIFHYLVACSLAAEPTNETCSLVPTVMPVKACGPHVLGLWV